MLEGSVNIYLSCCPWQAPYTSSLILKPNTYSSRVACFFLGSLLAIHVLDQFQISPEVANQHNAMFRGLTSSPWLNFTATLRGRHYYLHIRNKETETQESWAHCSRSQSKEIANACLTPKTMHRFRSHTAMNRFRSYINIQKMHLSIYYVPATIQSSW